MMVLRRRSSSTEQRDTMVTDPNVQAPIDLGVDNPNPRLPPWGNLPTTHANVNFRTTTITTSLTGVTRGVLENGNTSHAYAGETESGTGHPFVGEPQVDLGENTDIEILRDALGQFHVTPMPSTIIKKKHVL
uniref:Uncharacterized protein n=1 Tax=Cannabis sativa TaxID=3483 RepID=A0A803NIH8_CANSA